MNARSRAVVTLFALALLGCGRHVVLNPELVNARNDPDWTVRSVPVADAAVSPEPSAASPDGGGAPEP